MPIGDKMKVVIPKKEEEVIEDDKLPEDDGVVEPKNREHELELKLARQEGELSALKKNSNPQNPQMTMEQTKNMVFTDVNNMSDEDFRKKYNQSKHSATMAVMDQQDKLTKAETRALHAEVEASQELGSQYGNDFYMFKDKILDSMSDLSEEVKQDPVKIKRAMERAYLAEVATVKKVGPSRDNPTRRQIVDDFAKPKPDAVSLKKEEVDADFSEDIPTGSDIADSRLARNMGLSSREEAKEFSNKEFVPMKMGGGFLFQDPKKGFERVKQTP